MNKKSAILFFSVLFLLSLGVFYVMATISTPTNIVKIGDGIGANDWVKGDPITVNLTATVASESAPLTNVTFQFATAGNFSWAFVDNLGVFLENDTIDDTDQNWTYIDGKRDAAWNCTNSSASGALEIFCYNTTVSGLDGTSNSTLMVTINVTNVTAGDEDKEIWNILAANSVGDVTGTTETLGIDDQSPRLIEVNISDGNTTYHNSTWGEGYFLNGPLYIEALIEDSQLEDRVIIAYRCNMSNVSDSEAVASYSQDLILNVTAQQVGTIDQKGHWQSSIINCATINSTWNPQAGDEAFTFVFIANDTFNHAIQLNDTKDKTQLGSFNIWFDDGELLPVIAKVNVTQTTITGSDGLTSIITSLEHGAGLDGSSDYLAANTVTFDIELTGGQKPNEVWVVWNDTGAATTHFGPAVIGGSSAYFGSATYNNIDDTAALNTSSVSHVSTVDSSSSANATTVVYSTTLNLASNASTNFVFWVYANNTGDNYTRIGGPYRFQVDGGAPSITMTPPTDLVITPRASITYSCTESDAISGNNKIMWQLKKPGETVFTTKQNYENVGAGNADSITFTGDDTNLAGDYDVQCLAIDAVGNEETYTASSTENFAVHYSTTEAGVGAGEGAGAVADLDFTTQEEITVKEKQGVITTFTLDGTTVHTIKIKTVDETAGTVTIVIESDPITITLKIGETKEVDIDADGENDISVTLNGITDGAADITTKRLTPLPTEKPTEEVPPTEAPEEITPGAEAASKTWLWILIIVVIVVIGAGYWFMKRK